MIRARSVVGRTIALHLVAICVTSIFMPLALYLMLKRAAEDLHDGALRGQAQEILRYVKVEPDGGFELVLPRTLSDLYSEAYGRYAYAVTEDDGRVLFSSLGDDEAIVPPKNLSPGVSYFTAHHAGSDLYGVSLPAEIGGRHLTIQVSQDLAHRDVLIDDIVADFFFRVGWITAPILLLLLVIDVAIFRRVLRPIVTASRLAERIGPLRTDLRLPEEKIPQEVLPLVRAVNQALDRLEAGFRGQREFTADAAHELRTPLAILRMQIDMIRDRDLARSLRGDVENMTRLVNQLLEIAELESVTIGADETADLVSVATEIAAFIAPLAVAQDKDIAVSGAREPVEVRGSPHAIGRALRNLIENALAHTPTGTTVEIAVDRDGTVRVGDSGPGVPNADREQIFRRFWRRDRQRGGNAGLGLSIVARIAEMHGATVTVADRPSGGALFVLRFPEVIGPHAREPQPELVE